jgi:hypothetical protein
VLGATALTNDETKSRAEALFIRKEKQAREGSKAMAEYQAARAAEAAKTDRLRAERLSREAEANSEEDGQASAEQSRKKPSAPQSKRR